MELEGKIMLLGEIGGLLIPQNCVKKQKTNPVYENGGFVSFSALFVGLRRINIHSTLVSYLCTLPSQ